MSDHLRAQDAALTRLQALHPRTIDLGLERMARLCAALDHPERRLPPAIHVAGTNGKGSTTAFARAIAEAASLSVHVFTSPHLVRFAERIRLNGVLIDDVALGRVLDRAEAANAGEPITFFEITTAAAFLAMAEAPADLAVVEVGLGGLHDATNVIAPPAVSVIAAVDHDHREFLGDDLAGIALEKAGVAKPHVPLVVAHQRPEAFAAIEAYADRVGAPLLAAGRDWDAWSERGRLVVSFGDRLFDLPPPALPGAHQFANAGLAVAAVLALNDPRIDEEALAHGVTRAVWPARMQRITGGPLGAAASARGADLWLDGGHNPHAARAVADFVRTLAGRDGRPVVLIVGLLANKDAVGVFRAFVGLDAPVIATGFDARAAASPEALAATAHDLGLNARATANVDEALALALTRPGPAPHVVICGSLYLAGEVLAKHASTWPT